MRLLLVGEVVLERLGGADMLLVFMGKLPLVFRADPFWHIVGC